jgi:hypothetical protein
MINMQPHTLSGSFLTASHKPWVMHVPAAVAFTMLAPPQAVYSITHVPGDRLELVSYACYSGVCYSSFSFVVVTVYSITHVPGDRRELVSDL